MRTIHWGMAAPVAVAWLLHAGGAAAQTGFNGIITFTSNEGGTKPTTLVQTTKGNKVRLDGMGSDRGSFIIDNDAKVIMMVDPDKQQYMLMTEEDSKQMQEMMGPMMEKMKNAQSHRADSVKYKFANTGQTEIVAGVRCEVWQGEYTDEDSKKETGTACLAKGVGFAMAQLTYANPMMRPGQTGYAQYQQFRELLSGNKGVLKITRIKDGKSVTQLEATKIERTTVGDDAFKPPAGFKEIRLGDMMMQARNAMKAAQEKREKHK